MTRISLIRNNENPETTPILAEAIIKISTAIERLSNQSGLSEKALIVLIQDNCGTTTLGRKPSKAEVRIVLNSMKTLKGWYLRKQEN